MNMCHGEVNIRLFYQGIFEEYVFCIKHAYIILLYLTMFGFHFVCVYTDMIHGEPITGARVTGNNVVLSRRVVPRIILIATLAPIPACVKNNLKT